MKKITLLLIIGIILTYSNQSFSQTFDISDATTTDNTSGSNLRTVVETLSGTTMTVRIQNSNSFNPDQTSYLNSANLGGALGTTNGAVYQSTSSETGDMTITFNQAVNVTKLKMASTANSEFRIWTFTPTGGSNTVVTTASSNFSGNAFDITLNWTSVTEITITSSYTTSEQFVLDSVTLGSTNTAPIIANTSSGQSVNDTATITPFSSITTFDADGDNLSATITLDNNAKGVLTGSGLSGTGPYTITSTSPADLQTKLRALSFNPTDNRSSTSETTTFTVVIDDGTATDTNNTTTVISSAVAPIVTSVSVPPNATYTTGQNLDFTINFNENITVVTTGGTPQTAVTIGSTVRQATYISGTGSTALLFRYTIQSGDLDTDGITIGSLVTNGGSLQDTGSSNAILTLNSAGSTTGVLVGNPTITWTGTSDNSWMNAGNWDTNSVPTSAANVVIPKTGITNFPRISSSVSVNSINIASGASLIANATVTAPVTYNRNLPTTNWYLVSAPVSGETQQDVIANHTFASGTPPNIGIGAYSNNTGPSWIYANNSSTGPIPSGYGLSMKLAAPGDVSITGNINVTNVSTPVSMGSRDSFNLLGNPFTAFINSAVLAGDNSVINNATFWLWDGSQYQTYNNASPLNIAPGQGFFVEANANTSIVFSTANQSHQSSDTFMRQAPNSNFELFLEIDDAKASTKVFYIEDKTTGFDNGYDSKIFEGVATDFSVYTELVSNNEGKKLAIQTLPNSDFENMVIPIGIKAAVAKEITFTLNTTSFTPEMKFFLEDRLTNTFTRIDTENENYKVVLDEETNGSGRFYMHVTSGKSLSVDANFSLNNISVFKTNNSNLRITGLPKGKASLTMYNMLGKSVKEIAFISNGVKGISLPKLAAGLYLVKLTTDNGKLNKKIILE